MSGMSPNAAVRAAMRRLDPERLYTPAEVAAMFRVDPKTVARWAKGGRLPAIRTLGGHRRYRASDIDTMLHFDVPLP